MLVITIDRDDVANLIVAWQVLGLTVASKEDKHPVFSLGLGVELITQHLQDTLLGCRVIENGDYLVKTQPF